jgi:23S rRNA pseudouridine1911/1915/1917 synthase
MWVRRAGRGQPLTDPASLRLGDGTALSVLYEDSALLAIDKPAGWMLAPVSWDRTGRNLQRALESCLRGGALWARRRHLQFLRFIHRLDADTSGVLLLAKTPGALKVLGRLFQTRQMQKFYLAVVHGLPAKTEWTCRLPVGRDPARPHRMRVNGLEPRQAETSFRVLAAGLDNALVLAQPQTGRTHQIRVHLAAGGHPILGDRLYGPPSAESPHLALRAVRLRFRHPFSRAPLTIEAPWAEFVAPYGLSEAAPF